MPAVLNFPTCSVTALTNHLTTLMQAVARYSSMKAFLSSSIKTYKRGKTWIIETLKLFRNLLLI